MRRQDDTTLPVCIANERDARPAVRVVLDRFDRCRRVKRFLSEINHPVETLPPPPRWRTVILPVLLRPLLADNFWTSERSGFTLVTSEKS